jgi:alkylhydroperoxidase family enzyme
MQHQRVKSIKPPYSEATQQSFDIIMPPGMEPLNIFRAVGNNERVLSRMVKGGLLDKGSVSIAQRELVILRACAICHAEYEWGVHVATFAAKAGFTQEQIADTCSPSPDLEIWTPEQLALIRLVDELHQSANLSDKLWNRLRQSLSEEQLIEVIMLAGLYHAVSFIVNGLRIEHEKFAPGFPGADTRVEDVT